MVHLPFEGLDGSTASGDAVVCKLFPVIVIAVIVVIRYHEHVSPFGGLIGIGALDRAHYERLCTRKHRIWSTDHAAFGLVEHLA